MRPGRSRSRSAIASDSRACASPSSRSPAFRDRQASSASTPLSHHGTLRFSRERGALADELERAPLVTLVARDRAERSRGLRQAPHVSVSPVNRVALLDQLTGALQIASHHRADPQAVEEHRAAVLVLELLEDRETLRPHSSAAWKWPAMSRQLPYARRAWARRSARRLRPRDGRRDARTSGCPRSDPRRPTAARGRSRSPIPARSSHSAAPRRARRGSCPARPARCPAAARRGGACPHSDSRPPRRRGSTRRAAGGRRRPRELLEQLERVLADRVEHAQPAALPAADEVLDDERLERVEVGVADGLRRLEREASAEDGELRKSSCSSGSSSS